MRVRISDMGGSETRLCRLDIEDATAGQYTIRVFAIHAQGVLDQSYSFNGTTYSTAPFFLPTKNTSGRVTTSISIEAFVSRIAGGLAVENNRFEMSYFLQPVEVRVEVPTPLPPGAIVPVRRNAQYLIRDFTKLNGIQKSAGGTYRVWDIDFISIQALSMAQAANKCRELVAAANADPTFSLQYRRRAVPNEEWTAQRDGTFNQAMGEIARVIDFAVEEVQNQQKFNLVNPQLLKVNP
jgi:hypothetical protein